MLKFMRQILRNSRGATAVEYGLIASLLVIAIITALNGFADSANALFDKVDSKMAESVESVS